ncbi:beta-N-acetylhexosaminidase [Geothrix limicola]|uniref:beta-N-acetylhexosaminidase n=1 Tax=Geothrix limicola TaxID=2927978 RepID=A0ABQ5QB46_9BACT|nr:beta-N-acetylhexosaminidase [Geothrix limicola]GLH71686.1 beta-N-acetylhexosaminidase [Geothrix limicola]
MKILWNFWSTKSKHKLIKNFAISIITVFSLTPGLRAQAILPIPRALTPLEGTFSLGPGTRISARGEAKPLGDRLRQYLRPATGLDLPLVEKEGRGDIVLALDPALGALGAEGYRLEVRPERVRILAPKPAGLFYGIQSLRQLLPPQIFRESVVPGLAWTLPCGLIEDGPRFAWRGSHMDVSRHFMPKAFVKKHLDLMALHKLNVFHWHLTDDQGWRLEIKKYPRLTEVGAWRKATVIPWANRDDHQTLLPYDNVPHGGFYTQDDVREIVRYAADRFITIVPEIEMPGHSSAAVAAYPELGNFPGQKVEVVGNFGVFPSTFNVSDRTQAFLRDVLDEVVALFPSHYIHIGGDECPKGEWARSEAALARMKALGLVDAKATLADLKPTTNEKGESVDHPALLKLQSWFIRQAAQHLASKGRAIIGWDEIMEGGIDQSAAIMAWNRGDIVAQAAKEGHDVVATPIGTTYFDHYQSKNPEPYTIGGLLTLEQVYAYEPIPAGLDEAARRHILGAQAQIWTEYQPTPRHVEYMLWPRLAALAEVLWSPKEGRDTGAFLSRLRGHLQRLDVLDVNYRPLNGPKGYELHAQPATTPTAQ